MVHEATAGEQVATVLAASHAQVRRRFVRSTFSGLRTPQCACASHAVTKSSATFAAIAPLRIDSRVVGLVADWVSLCFE